VCIAGLAVSASVFSDNHVILGYKLLRVHRYCVLLYQNACDNISSRDCSYYDDDVIYSILPSLFEMHSM